MFRGGQLGGRRSRGCWRLCSHAGKRFFASSSKLQTAARLCHSQASLLLPPCIARGEQVQPGCCSGQAPAFITLPYPGPRATAPAHTHPSLLSRKQCWGKAAAAQSLQLCPSLLRTVMQPHPNPKTQHRCQSSSSSRSSSSRRRKGRAPFTVPSLLMGLLLFLMATALFTPATTQPSLMSGPYSPRHPCHPCSTFWRCQNRVFQMLAVLFSSSLPPAQVMHACLCSCVHVYMFACVNVLLDGLSYLQCCFLSLHTTSFPILFLSVCVCACVCVSVSLSHTPSR